jgi:hypothetical protein
LGVSYSTARARFDGLLTKLGIERGPSHLRRIASSSWSRWHAGEIDIDEALRRLETKEA